jgi:hypothetical protein
MNRHISLLFLFVLTTLFTTVHAQDDVSWPPRPEDIFTDAVELVEMSVTREFDNDARVVRVYDVEAQAWREFPYPDEFDRVYYVADQGDTKCGFYESSNDSRFLATASGLMTMSV